MAALPKLSQFPAEHPKTSRLVFSLAYPLPVLDRLQPLSAHIGPAYNPHRGGIRGPLGPAAIPVPRRVTLGRRVMPGQVTRLQVRSHRAPHQVQCTARGRLLPEVVQIAGVESIMA